MKSSQNSNERSFSIELNSKINLKRVTLTDHSHENVLLEGTIGELEHAGFTDGVILEIVGKKGILRVDLSLDELDTKKELK